MTPSAEATARLMNRWPAYCEPILADAVRALFVAGTTLNFRESSLITRRGQQSPRFCVVLKGSVRITAFTVDGRELLSEILQPGESWGVHPCLGGLKETNDSVAAEDTLVLLVKPAALKQLIWQHKDLHQALISLLCTRLNQTVTVSRHQYVWSARQRIAWRLVHLSEKFSGQTTNEAAPEIQTSQDNLASLVRLSRQHTNKILRIFEKNHMISLKYERIRILDMDGLRSEFSEAD